MMGGVFSSQQEEKHETVTSETSLLTVAQLSEQLQDLVDWQPFAFFLEGITQSDVAIIKTDNPLNVANQRNALFDLWLRRCPNPSWDHVITALDKAREHTLAQRIREHCLQKYKRCKKMFDHNQPSQMQNKPSVIQGQPASQKLSPHKQLTDPHGQPLLWHMNPLYKDPPVHEQLTYQHPLQYEQFRHEYPPQEHHDTTKGTNHKPTGSQHIEQTIDDLTAVQYASTNTAPPPQCATATVDMEIVQKLTHLTESFGNILYYFNKELKQKAQLDKTLLDQLILRTRQERAYEFEPRLNDVKDINTFITVIQDHCHFLDYDLLQTIAKTFLSESKELLTNIQKHEESVVALEHDETIEQLQNKLDKFIAEKLPNETPIIIKAQKAWTKNRLHAVRILLETLFPVEHYGRLFNVVPGSVCIMYLVPHHITESLITHSQHKKEFMRLTGIISLQVGETYVLQASEENEQFTFEMGLMEAVETRNNEAVKFILEYTHTNINIQTLDNGGLGTITDTEKEIQQTYASKTIEDQLAFPVDETMEKTKGRLTKANIQAGIIVATGSSAEQDPDADLYELDSNRNILWVWPLDPVGTTPLMIACINEDTEMIQLLLEHNANTNIQTRTGWTALMYAASLGNTRIVELLLKHNAEVDTIKKSNRATALMYACLAGNVNTVTALLKHGADHERKMDDGATPIYIASQEGHLTVVERLLQAKANPNTQWDNGATPLFIASEEGHSELVKRLLQAEANPDTPMDDGTTPLYIASQNGHSEVVKQLLQAKANPDTPTDDGRTPLYIASQNGHSEVVERLLQAEANPDTSKVDGATPLYSASEKGHSEVVKQLLQAKANSDTPKDDGATPLHAACYKGHLEIVKMLLQAKADSNYLTNDGRSPLYIASLRGHSDIVELLKHYTDQPTDPL